MPVSHKTYYSLLNAAQVESLCNQLREIDKQAALRFMLFWEKFMCEDHHVKHYDKEGKYNEMAYSLDLNSQKFEDLKADFRVKPENVRDFWDMVERIFKQFLIFLKNTDIFTSDQKIEVFLLYQNGIKTRMFLDKDFEQIASRLLPFFRETISELEREQKPTKLQGSVSKTERKKKFETLESLFYNPKILTELIDYLKNTGILDRNGKWIGTTGIKSEFLALIEVLKSEKFRLIRFSSYAEVGMHFANKFKIEISDRALTQHTNVKTDSITTYTKIIQDFLEQRTKY